MRYRNHAIEFSNGKIANEISDEMNLLISLEKLNQTVHLGQLDGQLVVASNNVKARFKK